MTGIAAHSVPSIPVVQLKIPSSVCWEWWMRKWGTRHWLTYTEHGRIVNKKETFSCDYCWGSCLSNPCHAIKQWFAAIKRKFESVCDSISNDAGRSNNSGRETRAVVYEALSYCVAFSNHQWHFISSLTSTFLNQSLREWYCDEDLRNYFIQKEYRLSTCNSFNSSSNREHPHHQRNERYVASERWASTAYPRRVIELAATKPRYVLELSA